jgi:hypothetical protein
MEYNFWGLKVQEEIRDGQRYWSLRINNPFEEQDHKFRIGLNEKLLKSALALSVKKFLIKVGSREIEMYVPDKKVLKEKNKRKDYTEIPSKFENSEPLRIYHFKV